MLTANVIPQHSAMLHCVWAPVYAGKDIPLAAVWVDTTQTDSADQEGQECDGRCSRTLQTIERRMKGGKLQKYWNVSELVDPRPCDGDRFAYHGKPTLPVAFECDWMMSNSALQRAVAEQMFFIGCGE